MDAFLESSVFRFIQSGFTVISAVIVISLLFKLAKSVIGRDTGSVARTALLAILVAAIGFNLSLPIRAASAVSSVVQGIFNTFDDTILDPTREVADQECQRNPDNCIPAP